MKTPLSRVWIVLGLLSGARLAPDAAAQALPLEIRQDQTRYNFQSTNGVPISSTRGTPPGSNGAGPTAAQQQAAGLTTIAATASQFQSLVSFGSVVRPQTPERLNRAVSYAANAENLNLPRGDGDQTYILLRARVGVPFVSRQVSFLFGSVIPVPAVDEYGKALSSANTAVTPPRPVTRPEDYWLAEPYTTTTHTNYYWSPHAQQVFAVNAGPLQIVWRKAVPSTPVGTPSNVGTVLISGSTYTIYTNQYVVSGSAVKPPRRMYWTEGAFRETGKPVIVPSARVGDLAIIYNNNFVDRVAEEYKAPGQVPITDPNDPNRQPLGITRTLWYDRELGRVLAYNLEGRVFVELLGDQNPDGRTRKHLGIEIVDVLKQPDAANVTIELGELLTAYQNDTPDDAALFPEPLGLSAQTFTFRHNINGTDRVEYFAIRETKNLNDLQLHWLEEGLQGLKWPSRFVRYNLMWPTDVAKYSHYVRPLVGTEAEARLTAVPLPNENAPIIAYQDPLDQPRAKLTEKFEYYTFLTPEWPAHRGLLRLNSSENVHFERIFSWLDESLKNATFAGSVATNLSTWSVANNRHVFPVASEAPRVVNLTVNVGDRITAPTGEAGAAPGTNYLAGHIRDDLGNSFNAEAYVDPFKDGFDAANRGAIIPVNAIPGTNRLEIWWFRRNEVDLSKGFKNSYWPSVIGRYTLRWPTTSSEIVLASNKGSGPLTSLQANGRIYFQNDARLPGYNPNEEHALMQGGQAFALRDDLNITTNNSPLGPYSSHPYVLLSYTETDDRPAMRTFRVSREKPEEGILFDYEVKAGTILQAPMPLPLLEKAFAPKLAGQAPVTLNAEIGFWTVADSTVATAGGLSTWTLTTTERHFFRPYRPVAVQRDVSPTPAPTWVYVTNVSARSLAGLVSERRPYQLSPYTGSPATAAQRWRYAINKGAPLAANAAVNLFDPATAATWSATVISHDTNALYVELQFGANVPEAAKSATALVLPLGGGANGLYDDRRVSYEPLPEKLTDTALQDFYASFTLQDRKGNRWVYRGPHSEGDTSSLVMKFYYKTLPGFFFPTLALAAQPPVGTVTPYLRAIVTPGTYEGDPVYGNLDNDQEGDDNPLGITYRPVWPNNVPVLQMAETLTTPKRGLPAARGQTSLEVVYQQSQVAGGPTKPSVILHDPTREKEFALAAPDDATGLHQIPGSVKTQEFRGKTYFPNLPPHLAERFFFDPNRGANGALVFKGEFVDAPVGDKYVLLNVLGKQDEEALKALCLTDDDDYGRWTAAIAGLSTKLELFVEDKGKPGTYIPSSPVTVGRAALAQVTNGDQAVDSYALTATGPGIGYVTLIAGNGRAFTPEGDPVSVLVVKVVDTLYRGEVNIVESSNPLNEKLTLQQVIDLAAKIEDYTFEWKIASPVDGFPPNVYENTPRTLMGNGTWNHVRHPIAGDQIGSIQQIPAARVSADVGTSVSVISGISFETVSFVDNRFNFRSPQGHTLVAGNAVVLRSGTGTEVSATVHASTVSSNIVVEVDPNQENTIAASDVLQLYERALETVPQSVVFRTFTEDAGKTYSQFWLSLDLAPSLGAKVYLDGQFLVTANTGTGDTPISAAPAALFPLGRAYRLSSAALAGGIQNANGSRTHTVAVELFSKLAVPNAALNFNVRLEAFESRDVTSLQWLPLDADRYQDGVRAVLGGTADVRSLADNYLIMRYQAKNNTHASWKDNGAGGNAVWSQWTTPQLAEGWIKRVLKGINPFNQRVTDLFNNSVNTTVSAVAQAGQRWEGDVALNLETINDTGLIEIYETVLGRGKMLSIGGGINYGPANDALLLAAGYINDLYMILGNEAWADAANPTIGIGTKDQTYGEIATALFSFRGQLPSLLEEELALLRGRDDFLQPGVELRPVYNRMVWNYTRGIDAGEVVYALNYNILDQNTDGVVDAEDARRLFPQGHGDAYGHFLTALKGYYSLLLDPNFDWVPRVEAVTVLGKPVTIDYQDERKFAAAAGAVARTGKQIFDLTWRKDYHAGEGWAQFSESRSNPGRSPSVVTTRYWGMDHWAARTGQGAYLNWVVGNAILPDRDPDPKHTGTIQQIDRTTVPELKELPAVADSLQVALDNAEAGLNPLGLTEGSIPFDLNPLSVANGPFTHFEQIYQRAKDALGNAVVAFDDAKDVTRLMRSEADSLADFKTAVDQQELAYTNSLIEIYGTPYPDDVGPGKTYRAGFAGPDTVHYMYVDTKELTFGSLLDPQQDVDWIIDTQTFTPNWLDQNGISDFNFIQRARNTPVDGVPPTDDYLANTNLYVKYTLSSHGFFKKPEEWNSRRATPGRIQQAISEIIQARNAAYSAFYDADAAKYDLDWAILALEKKRNSHTTVRDFQSSLNTADQVVATAKLASDITSAFIERFSTDLNETAEAVKDAIPASFIAGLAAGGDLTAPIRGAIKSAAGIADSIVRWGGFIGFTAQAALEYATETSKRYVEFNSIAPEEWNQELREAMTDLRDKVYGVNNHLMTINERLQQLDDAQRNYQAMLAEANRIQEEREVFRQRAAAVIQGFRTRDAAFRIFRTEKLERYKTLFDLAARYAFMTAQAYDYDTGLLHTDQGREFISRIVRARAIGLVQNGAPQFAGSDTGDPGLSSALAQMQADWQVIRSRLGFNNPDSYGTTVSLRAENFRILPGTNGNVAWREILNQARRANLLDDPDVRRYCLQIDPGNGLPVPGLVLEFSTTIANGVNLFGHPLAAWDHAFDVSSFATKLFAVGVALEGYQGMDDPNANSAAVAAAAGATPGDPDLSFLDPNALSATPYVYMFPVGVDSMRSPPLGDSSVIRTWNVQDVTIPLPFNIGGSDFSTHPLWQSSDSLSEPMFSLRKHQAFRPVSDATLWDDNTIYSTGGELWHNKFSNTRLIGRSLWNSKWKIVIPGKTLLSNPDEGLERFIQTVNDVKLYFHTYSYSGN